MRATQHHQTNRSEQGFVIVLLTLSLFALFGAVALVVDLGAVMLARQRMQTANDLAALSASQLVYDGQEASARNQAKLVALASNLALYNSPADAWTDALLRVDVQIKKDVSVYQEFKGPTYFSRIIGAPSNTQTLESRSVGSFSGSSSSLHLIAVVEIEPNFSDRVVYGPECGLSSSAEDTISDDPDRMCAGKTGYCKPGCADLKTASKAQLREMIDLLGPSDQLSLIQFGHFAVPLVVQETMNTEGKRVALEAVEHLEDLHLRVGPNGIPIYCLPGNCFRYAGAGTDIAAGLFLARDLLAKSTTVTDRTSVALLSSGSANFKEMALVAGTGVATEEYLEKIVDYTDYEGELIDAAARGQGCSLSYGQSEGVTFVNNASAEFSGLITKDIEELGASIITVGMFSTPSSNWLGKQLYGGRQGADLLKLIAGDLSSMPYSPEAPIKCAAKNRDPKRSGKYFNPQPWTYSFEATAKELVAYARGSTGKISLQFPKLIP